MSTFSGPGLVFAGERDCRVEEAVVDASALAPGEVAVEVELSIVSAGTEVANFTGLDPGTRQPGSWNAYPHRPGYGAVGRVVALGPPLPGEAASHRVGERVFAICRHARYGVADTSRRPVVGIDEGDDARQLVLARMASVAVTAVRKASRVDLGATAFVVGLGLVGNFAAQLLQLAGMRVVGLDRAPHRVDMARAVGLDARLVEAAGETEVLVASGLPSGADLVVEASGVPDASTAAVALAADGGEVVLLGTPRGAFTGDATAMLVEVHRRGITVIGALEWLLPLRSGPWQARWSLEADYGTLFDLFRAKRVRTDGLVTDVVVPALAQATYSRLAEREPGIGAVLFDWS